MPILTTLPETGTPSRSYSSYAVKFAEKVMRRFIQQYTPSVQYAEDGLPVRPDLQRRISDPVNLNAERERLTPAEALTVSENINALLEFMIKDRLELTNVPQQKNLNNYLTRMNPEYTPLSEEEMKQRSALSGQYRLKFAEYAAKRNIVTALVNSQDPRLDRTAECLLWIDTSEEAIKWNKQLKEDLSSPNPYVRKSAMARGLNRIIKDSPIESLDLVDGAAFCENMEKYYSVLSSGPELKKLLEAYSNIPGELDQTIEKNIPRLLCVQDASSLVRAKIDICCSPIYGQMRTEDFLGTDMVDSTVDADAEPIDLNEVIYPEDDAPDYFATAPVQQIFIANSLNIASGSSYLNKNLTPKERYENNLKSGEAFSKDLENQIKQKHAEYAKTKQEDLKLVNKERIPQGLSPEEREERIRYEIQLRKNIEASNKIIKAHNDEIDKNPKANKENKLAEINLTEDKIQSYLTPERIALHKSAKNIVRNQTERKNALLLSEVPTSLQRTMHAIAKNPWDPQNKAHNDELSQKLLDPGYSGQLFRKKLIADSAEKALTMDEKKLSLNLPLAEAGKYALDNIDACELGTEFQRIHRDMKASLGFDEKPELKDRMKQIEDRVVTLGGNGKLLKETLATESFIVFPIEDMNSDQIDKISSAMINGNSNDFGIPDVNDLIKYSQLLTEKNLQNSKEFKLESKASAPVPADFVDALPDTRALKDKLDSISRTLQSTDHWYNRSSSSPEYKEMCTALQTTSAELGKLETLNGDAEKFLAAMKELRTNMARYQRHVGDKGKNRNQQTRLDATIELRDYLLKINLDVLPYKIKQSNAVATPEQKKQYEAALTTASVKKTGAEKQQPDAVKNISENLRTTAQQQKTPGTKALYDTLCSARDKLSEILQKEPFDAQNTKSHFATAIVCNTLISQLARDANYKISVGNKKIAINEMTEQAMTNYLKNESEAMQKKDIFKGIESTINADSMRDFLRDKPGINRSPIMREFLNGVKASPVYPNSDLKLVEQRRMLDYKDVKLVAVGSKKIGSNSNVNKAPANNVNMGPK